MSSRQSKSQGRKRGSKSTSNTKPTTATTKSTSPYDRVFQQNLVDHGVYPDEYEYPDGRVPPQPDNWEEINQRLIQPRSSLSPSQFSDGKFRKFKRADAHAFKEKQVSESMIPFIEGKVEDAKCRSGGIPFTNLDYLTDGTLVPGNPDIYYGARPEQLDRQVRNELTSRVVPSTQHDLPIAPNFFLAAKGPDGSLAVAGRQACYDGALGARGIQSLQSYRRDKLVDDNNAYTVTSIYHGGTLKMYTSHPKSTGPGGRPEYFMSQLKGYSMTGDPETFRKGATAYRNARDWAKEQRDEAITQANERATRVHAKTPVVNEDSNVDAGFLDSETSTDELTLDLRLPAKRSSTHSKQSRQPQRKRRTAGKPSNTGHGGVSAVVSVTKARGNRGENSAERGDNLAVRRVGIDGR
jgi:hypothetical protein